jgi:acylphosphatase
MASEVYCQVRGEVQQVGYRDFAQVQASRCDVTGWAKNNPDGTVMVVAQGLPDNIKQFIEELHEGSVLAVVHDVAVEWRSPQQLFTDFVVKY